MSVVMIAIAVGFIAWWVNLIVVQVGKDRGTFALRNAQLVVRADQQHAQVLAGDKRGIYGAFPPADLS